MTRPICGRSSGDTGRTPDHVAMTGASASAGISRTASLATIRATSRPYESAASDGSRDVPARIEPSASGWIVGDDSGHAVGPFDQAARREVMTDVRTALGRERGERAGERRGIDAMSLLEQVRLDDIGRELGFDPANIGPFYALDGDTDRRSRLGPTPEVLD